jgi:hypothetical protein
MIQRFILRILLRCTLFFARIIFIAMFFFRDFPLLMVVGCRQSVLIFVGMIMCPSIVLPSWVFCFLYFLILVFFLFYFLFRIVMIVLISCTENPKNFIDKKVIFDEKNISVGPPSAVCRLSTNFVIRITFFPFNLDTSPFQVKVF